MAYQAVWGVTCHVNLGLLLIILRFLYSQCGSWTTCELISHGHQCFQDNRLFIDATIIIDSIS